MKTVFEIGQEKKDENGQTLLLEIGTDYCCAATLNSSANTISHIRYTTFAEQEASRQLPACLTGSAAASYEAVVIASAYPQALLYPHKYFQNDPTALNLVYDLPAQDYFHDRIAEWQLVAQYSLPQEITSALRPLFPEASFTHVYTPAIKVYNGYVADHQLSVHFTGQQFRVLLKKDMAVCLAQTYRYTAPLDVVYYLLRICAAFNLSQEEVYLILSGFVEKESALFSELQQFFTHVNFAQPPAVNLPQSQYPHYFFTSLYNLAACVS